MKEQQWITDRLPTTTDSVCGLVMVPSERVEGWAQKTFASIELGEPWAPWPKMPPYKPKKTTIEWLEMLPDGYRERAIEQCCQDQKTKQQKGLPYAVLAFEGWNKTDEGDDFWSSVYLAINEDNTVNHDKLPPLPLEPEPEYWSRPSDFPPVCWLFVNGSDTVCRQVTGFDTSLGRIILHGRKVAFEYIRFARWSDRPFDRFEDGKPCVKGCSGEN